VKGGVETGHLHRLGEGRDGGADAGEVVGLVQRRERGERVEPFDQVGREPLRRVDVGAAMDDAVADARDPSAADPGGERREDRGEAGGVVGGGDVARRPSRTSRAWGPSRRSGRAGVRTGRARCRRGRT
jgi:hypothetical protein